MSEDQEEEPSIEEILDSIRQIISDDDEEEGNEEAAPEEPPAEEPEPAPEPAPEPEPEPEGDIDAIELTEKVDDEPEPEPDPEPEVEAQAEEEPEPEPEPMEIDMQDADDAGTEDLDSLLTDTAEDAAYEGFAELAKKTAIEHNGITVEEIVRTELRPLLKDWLDKHLPSIIERLVQEELERVAKRAAEE